MAAINSVVELSINADVLFDVDKWELKPAANIILGDFVEAIKVVDHGTILIEGHTDDTGSEEYNMSLSKKRAEAVRDYLIAQGVDASRLTAKWYGETQPKYPNDEANRAKNRRVEIKVYPAEAPSN